MQRFTFNVTSADMIQAGYSPSVRLFEAAACGVPIISDYWKGLEEFFDLGRGILVVRTAGEVRGILRELPETDRQAIAKRARRRVSKDHTSASRSLQLEQYANDVISVLR